MSVSRVILLACVLVACLIPQARFTRAAPEPSAENGPTHSPPTDICQLPPYHIKGLTRENYWFAVEDVDLESPELLCFDPLATSCEFYFAFCHPIKGVNNSACQGAAVCQVGTTPNGTVTSYSMGKFSNTTQFYETNGTVAGSFYVDVVNGSRNTGDDKCTTGVTTRIILECNPNVEWKTDNVTNFITVNYSEPCSYTITLPYAGACLRAATPTATIAPATSTASSSVSPSHTVKPTSSTPSNSTATPSSSPSGSRSSKPVSPTTATTSTSVPSSTAHASRSSSVGPNPTVSPTPPPSSVGPNPTVIPPPAPTGPPYKPTSHHETTTTNKTPTNNDSHVIHGLIAGIVIFALISVVLLVLLIFTARVIYTKQDQYRRVSNNDDM